MKSLIEKNNMNKVTVSIIILLCVAFLILLFIAVKAYIVNNDGVNGGQLFKKYTFPLQNVACQSSNGGCEKVVEVAYNGARHTIKIKSQNKEIRARDLKLAQFEIYFDNKLVQTLDAGDYNLSFPYKNNFEGYVYVMNSKYVAIALPRIANSKEGYGITFYGDNVADGIDFSVKIPGHKVCSDSSCTKVLNNFEDLKFNGKYFEYWTQNCQRKETVKIRLNFDGDNVNQSILEKINGMYGEGEVC